MDSSACVRRHRASNRRGELQRDRDAVLRWDQNQGKTQTRGKGLAKHIAAIIVCVHRPVGFRSVRAS
eukprot:252472-Rhodomonas_salina.1